MDCPLHVCLALDSDRTADIQDRQLRAISEHTQLDCGPDPTSPALRASSASFVKIDGTMTLGETITRGLWD
jgi:hypothetical protein